MQRSKRKAGRGALELLSGADSDDYEEAPARAPKAMKSDKVGAWAVPSFSHSLSYCQIDP
jgi:hypothetical protein